LLDFLAVFDIPQPHLNRNLLFHAYGGGHLLFREEKEVEHEMFPFIGAAGKSAEQEEEDMSGDESEIADGDCG
jgi:hypothetical protein